MQVDDDLIPYRAHAGYVLFWALMTVCLYWSDERGSMFTKGVAKNKEVEGAAPSQESAEVAL
eukprot:1883104-Pyramimonas_sp.AAC.1